VELSHYQLLAPEIIMLITAAVALLAGLARTDSMRKLPQLIALVGLGFAFIAALQPLPEAATAELLFAKYFNPQYITLLACAIGFLSVLAAWDMPFKAEPGVADSKFRGEFFSMMLFSLAGVSMVGKVNDIVWLFIVLELVSIPTYIMVAAGRSQIIAQEAGVKYFFLGALAAAIYLFGFSYLYGYAGSTRYLDIMNQFSADLAGGRVPIIGLIGLLLVLIGVSYKIAAVPLHFYTPDVYQGAATPVTAFLAFAPKAAGVVALITILALTGFHFDPTAGTLGRAILAVLSVMAAVTMTLGNVLALLQRNIKRMLAYSSIAHSGYMLVGLVAGPGDGLNPMSNGIHATLFYLGAYSLMNLGAFAVLIYLQGKSDAGEDLDDLAGVSKEHPAAAFAMAICLFSLIGMPLTVGFLGKFYIVTAALANHHTALAVIVVINAAIAAAYYLRVIAAMYLRDAWNPFSVRKAVAPRLAATFCAIAVIFFGVVPAALLNKAAPTTTAKPAAVAAAVVPSR